ncbi:hypothetical protein QOL99_02640 [Deinococcus sp. MIMF12]|uniref:Cytochrome c domain-containing protein n=1 Tax=Deinococcus rhizophilus TaxID=3049544 RepID=A0ABT7JDD0_9DEIO|nr:hypothetical protein [Deinococcus rhizophilus]MDL2343042.1 hypothetical protein [Deinococcus rhizophilus]
MRNNIAIFAVTFLMALGGGLLVFGRDDTPEASPVASEATTAQSPASPGAPDAGEHAETVQDMAQEAAPAVGASEGSGAASPAQTGANTEIFAAKGCVGCHSVNALDVSGGSTGPDLSQAFVNVPDKHGKELGDFLKEPTSAVMSSVISASPLSDEERETIVNALRVASEQ